MPHLLPRLTTPADLFRKAEADLSALESDPGNERLAFNLFVTIEHMPDWLGLKREHTVAHKSELRVVAHIANGQKHPIDLNPQRHNSVDATSADGYSDDYVAPGYVEERSRLQGSAPSQ
jgi:hypothetical protein